MNKNKYKLIFSLFLLFWMQIVYSADFVKLKTENINKQRLSNAKNGQERAIALGLSRDHDLKEIKSNIDKNGIKHTRYQQYIAGIPVWGQQIITHSKQGIIHSINGTMMAANKDKIHKLNTKETVTSALIKAKEIHRNNYPVFTRSNYLNVKSEKTLVIDNNQEANLAFIVSFFTDTDKGGNPSRPYFLLNGETLDVIEKWEGLTTAQIGTGPGGNLKTGQYNYGINNLAMLDVTENGQNANGENLCQMVNARVTTVDLNHLEVYFKAPILALGNPFSYICPENTHKTINGAFSPINDAHYFGGITYDFFNSRYGMSPLVFPLIMNVHYFVNYENAFWNGSTMNFGDGGAVFYPLVDINISAHEIAHGFTEQNSGLIYAKESGGINEAFSDMTGEAAEYYLRASNDWQVGTDVVVGDINSAMRYMANPPQDQKSIDHTANYVPNMDVHHSSGIYNKAFYKLATTGASTANGNFEWNTLTAFDVMFHANLNYWSPSTNFNDGACGAIQSAIDLAYPVADVVTAFSAVGVACPVSTNIIGRPAITSIVIPTQNIAGSVGSYVILNGRHFCVNDCYLSNSPETVITVNGVIATSSYVQEDSATFIIPSYATTGKISITVSANNQVKTGTSYENFTVIPLIQKPLIDPLNITTGGPGAFVYLTGQNFCVDECMTSTNTETTVTMSGISLVPLSVNDNYLDFLVPQGAITGPITVTVRHPLGTVSTDTIEDDFIVPNSSTPPEITGVYNLDELVKGNTVHFTELNPAEPGYMIYVAGSNFCSGDCYLNRDKTRVKVGDIYVAAENLSNNNLNFIVKQGMTTSPVTIIVAEPNATGVGQSADILYIAPNVNQSK